MKTLILPVLICFSIAGYGQMPDASERCKAEMQKLAYLVGDWKGTALHSSRDGQVTVMQQEHIEWKLQGLVLGIEGTGRQKNEVTGAEDITFQAFAVVNFDPVDNEFKFRSFIKEGYRTDAYFKVIGENAFEWGFDIQTGGKTRYFIRLDPVKKTWKETGEYSPDGTRWIKFVELDLVKQG